MELECKACGSTIRLEQPYPYHAGFSDNGFLYDDAGTQTLVWSAWDPLWEECGSKKSPWSLSLEEWAGFEAALLAAPSGGRWRASNPARCPSCSTPLRQPLSAGDIYYLVFPGSIVLGVGLNTPGLESVLSRGAAT